MAKASTRGYAGKALLDSPLAHRLELIDLRNNRELPKKAADLRKLLDRVLLLDES